MKKNKYVYRVGEFTYYTGEKCKYIMAAVSVPLVEECIDNNKELKIANVMSSIRYGNDDDVFMSECIPVVKQLRLGIAVCRPCDMENFNEELGVKIATGKALGANAAVIGVSRAGLINKTVVEAVLTQETQYFEANPSLYLAGYAEAKKKYDKEQQLKEYANSLTEDEVNTIKAIRSLNLFDDDVDNFNELLGRTDLL